MRSFVKRLVALGVVFMLVLFSFPTSVSADAPTWCKVYIKQGGVLHPRGCTVCTLELILQNSGTLKGEWQLSGAITSRSWRDGSPYDKFDIECATPPGISVGDSGGTGILESQKKTSDSVNSGNFVSVANRVCNPGVTWEFVTSNISADGQTAKTTSSVVVGLGDMDFLNMENSEVITAMKAFWNAGYWCAVGIRYKGGSSEPSNGPAGYKGNHWAMLSGVDDNDVYFNDPASGATSRLSTATAYGGKYQIVYLVLFRTSSSTPAKVAGGNVQFSQADYSNLNNMGVSGDVINGLGSGSQSISLSFGDALLSNSRLQEANLEDFLEASSVDNLSQADLEMLDGWKNNVDGNKKEFGFIAMLRWIVSLAGILITLWALLVYLAFWFDHINSFVYLDALHLITLGKLHICPPNEKPTFSLGKSVKDKTVSHGQILVICGTALLFGVALVSGVFYQAVSALVRLVQSVI